MKVGKAVEKRLAELKTTRLPAGIEYHHVFYQPERVTDSLTTFFINLIESVIIVVAILMLAMGFKSGVIIGFSLIVIVIGSFLMLGAVNGSMQRVSLASFILAMGMLVDNAIVIIDGILVDLKLGKPRRGNDQSAKNGDAAIGRHPDRHTRIFARVPLPDTAGWYVATCSSYWRFPCC